MPTNAINQDDQLIVSPRQRKNPVLRFIKNVSYIEGDIASDFMISKDIGVLFLSLKYHRVNTKYITNRLESLVPFRLRNLFLLCQVDVNDYDKLLLGLLTSTFGYGCKILLSWSARESAAVIEILKLNRYKGIESLNKKQIKTHNESVSNLLLNVKSVNNTDVNLICEKFNSLREILHFNPDTIQDIKGLGQKKLESLSAAFTNDFY
nr:DNA repair protein [Theileria orientalis]